MIQVVTLFLRRPVTSLMIFLAICMLGTIAVRRLPVGLLPNMASPGITIITRYSGVAAEKIDEMLTVPIERQTSDIPGMERMLSVSSEGESKVNLLFGQDVDIKTKILEATERVALIRHRFPRDVEEPYIIQYDPGDRPVFILSFSSQVYDLKRLREIVDRQIKLKFERIEGVSEVFVGGGFEREIQLVADPSRFFAHGISPATATSAVARSNIFGAGGTSGHHIQKNVYVQGKFRSTREMQQVLVPVRDGNPVRLSMLAEIKDAFRERETIARTDGEERVTVYVQKAGSSNTLAITDACLHVLAEVEKMPDIRAHVSYNQGEQIARAIGRVTESCVTGALLVFVILYIFLGRVRRTLVIVLTLPASVLATFFFMYLSGLELNVMSLSGLAMGAGMLIDGSIVVSESIDSLFRETRDAAKAVIEGTVRVFGEIVAATLSIIVVFLPLMFTDPETRSLYQGLALTVVYSISVSLFCSLTIMPCFLYLAMRKEEAETSETGTVFRTLLIRFVEFGNAKFMDRLPWQSRIVDTLRRFFLGLRPFTDLNLWRKKYRILVRPVFYRFGYSIAIPVLLLLLVPVLFSSLKKEYFDPLDAAELEASIDLATGVDLPATEKTVRAIESSIRESPLVKEVSARIEKWHATLNIKMSDEGKRKGDVQEVIGDLKRRTERFQEAFVYFSEQSEAGGRELNIEFYGDDLAVLKDFATRTSGEIKGKVAGVEQAVLRFREPKGELLVRLSRTKTAVGGTDLTEVGSTVRNFLSGSVVSKYYDKDREVDIRFRASPDAIRTPAALQSFVVPLEGRGIPLSALADFEESQGETKIWRKNKRKSVSITLKLGDRSVDRVAEDVDVLFSRTDFPPDVIYDFGEEYQKLKRSQSQMLLAIGLSVLILYLLLGILFESFMQPLLILVPVPFTVVGVLAFLAIARMSMNMGVYIGMIMLGGIAVNNSIILVSTVNRVLTAHSAVRGRARIRHILRAASTRIRPILMTTLTTVFGMAPMAFDFSEGSGLWRPLAMTVSVGLVFALLVTLVLVPFACYLQKTMQDRLMKGVV